MVPPLTITRHAFEQFQQHVAPLADREIDGIMRQVHREQILLTAMDPKHPDTPFYWGSWQGIDFALAIGPDANVPGGNYVATTIGLGHLERLLRTRRAMGTAVNLAGSALGEGSGNRPFAGLSARVEVTQLEWPEETGGRALKYQSAPHPQQGDTWALVWRWIEALAGSAVQQLEFLPNETPSGWWATLVAGRRTPRCFLGSNAMVELFLLDQPASLLAFGGRPEAGICRVVPLPAGVDSQRGLPAVAREAPEAQLATTDRKRAGVRALYPGTFDPITKGHLHLLSRACQIFETVVIAAARNPGKGTMFTLEERLAFIQMEVAGAGLEGVEVTDYESLTVDLAQAQGCQVIVRGLRAISDYEYEVQMAIINKTIAPEIETVFLMADKDFSFISSSIIKDILRHGGEPERVRGMLAPEIALELLPRVRGEGA